MHLYSAFLLEVESRTNGSTISHLKGIGRGKYAEIVDDCVRKKLIIPLSKNTLGEDLYFISDKGRKFLDNPKEDLL